VYLQEGSIRACGLSTLIKISEFALEKQENAALKRTINQFKADSSQEVKSRLRLQSQPK